MAWWSRKERQPENLIPSEMLAEYGRFAFLGPDGYEGSIEHGLPAWELISPLVLGMGTPDGRARVLSELRRHGAEGEWQRVGAWKIVGEYDGVDYGADAQDIVESGYRALLDMRVTNVRRFLGFGEWDLWQELIGSPPPDDFAGPPVFDSIFGPSRSYYFDQIIAASARQVTRLPEDLGVVPGELDGVARSVWSFGLLLYRGEKRVHVDIRFEPSVVQPAVAAASHVDHMQFIDELARTILKGDELFRDAPWAALGAARFAEEYLQPRAVGAAGYARLADFALRGVLDGGLIDYDIPLDVFTSLQRARLTEIEAGR